MRLERKGDHLPWEVIRSQPEEGPERETMVRRESPAGVPVVSGPGVYEFHRGLLTCRADQITEAF